MSLPTFGWDEMCPLFVIYQGEWKKTLSDTHDDYDDDYDDDDDDDDDLNFRLIIFASLRILGSNRKDLFGMDRKGRTIVLD